jgi:uncharacterized protein
MGYYPNYYVRNTSTNNDKSTLTLQGIGKLTATPNLGVLSIGVMTENENVQVAQQENAIRSNQVIQVITNKGIPKDDIQTSSYTIQPNYDYQDGKSVLKGYRVEHLFEITIRNLQQAGEIYDAAIEAGANIAGNLDFQVSNYEAYYQQALQVAIKNAQEKAKSISAQLGVPLNPIPVKITEEHSPVAPMFKVAYATEPSVQANTPIQSRDIDVNASVIAVFHYQ